MATSSVTLTSTSPLPVTAQGPLGLTAYSARHLIGKDPDNSTLRIALVAYIFSSLSLIWGEVVDAAVVTNGSACSAEGVNGPPGSEGLAANAEQTPADRASQTMSVIATDSRAQAWLRGIFADCSGWITFVPFR